MKTKDILLIGALGLGAFFLLKKPSEEASSGFPSLPFSNPLQIPLDWGYSAGQNLANDLLNIFKDFIPTGTQTINNEILDKPIPKPAPLPNNFNNMAQQITDNFRSGLITIQQANTQTQVLNRSLSAPIPVAVPMAQTIQIAAKPATGFNNFATNYRGEIIGNAGGYRTYQEARAVEAQLGRGYK